MNTGPVWEDGQTGLLSLSDTWTTPWKQYGDIVSKEATVGLKGVSRKWVEFQLWMNGSFKLLPHSHKLLDSITSQSNGLLSQYQVCFYWWVRNFESLVYNQNNGHKFWLSSTLFIRFITGWMRWKVDNFFLLVNNGLSSGWITIHL